MSFRKAIWGLHRAHNHPTVQESRFEENTFRFQVTTDGKMTRTKSKFSPKPPHGNNTALIANQRFQKVEHDLIMDVYRKSQG